MAMIVINLNVNHHPKQLFILWLEETELQLSNPL